MNGMKYTLGIDLGSSSIKVAIINAADGTALATSRFPKTEMEIQWKTEDRFEDPFRNLRDVFGKI